MEAVAHKHMVFADQYFKKLKSQPLCPMEINDEERRQINDIRKEQEISDQLKISVFKVFAHLVEQR